MSNNIQPAAVEEIDLGQVIVGVWRGKWLIVGVTFFCALCGLAYLLVTPKIFTASIELRPISTSQFDEYTELNSLGFFNITKEGLMSGLIDELQSRDELVDAIRDVGLLERANYASDEDFKTALLRTAFSIKILPPVSQTEGRGVTAKENWTIDFVGQNADKYLSAVGVAITSAEKKYQLLLASQFAQKVALLERSKTYQIEDTTRAISNALIDYDKKTSNQVEYLREQAQIARVLGIAKNTIESQSFASGSSVVTGLKADSPFYMRGYEAIEKELELLEGRSNKKAFVPQLVELEAAKRQIEQDPVVPRAKASFEATPIMSEEFSAAQYTVDATIPVAKTSRLKVMVLSIVLGLILGLAVLFVRNAIRVDLRHD